MSLSCCEDAFVNKSKLAAAVTGCNLQAKL